MGTLTTSQTLTVASVGTLEGQVTGTSGSGVAQVTVSVYDPADPGNVFQTTTDGQGDYRLAVLPGSYTVVVTDTRSGVTGPVFAQATTAGVAIAAGATTTLPLNLTAASITLSGHIGDGQNDAPIGGDVTALNGDGVPVAQTAIDTDGDYQFNTLAPGTYTITASAVGFVVQPSVVTLIASQQLAGFTLSATWLVDPPGPPGGGGGIVPSINAGITNLVAGTRTAVLGEPRAGGRHHDERPHSTGRAAQLP